MALSKTQIYAIIVVIIVIVAACAVVVVAGGDDDDTEVEVEDESVSIAVDTTLEMPEDTLLRVFGNVNGDAYIDDDDLTYLANILNGDADQTYYADVNQDGYLTVDDITYLEGIMNGDDTRLYYQNYNYDTKSVAIPVGDVTVIYYQVLEAVVLLGYFDHVVASDDYSCVDKADQFPGIENVTNLGLKSDLTAEDLMSAGATTIITGSATYHIYEEVEEQLTDDYDVVRLCNGASGLEIVWHVVTLGYILGSDGGYEYLDFYNEVLGVVDDKLSSVDDDDVYTGISVYFDDTSTFKIHCENSGTYEVLEFAGLIELAEGFYETYETLYYYSDAEFLYSIEKTEGLDVFVMTKKSTIIGSNQEDFYEDFYNYMYSGGLYELESYQDGSAIYICYNLTNSTPLMLGALVIASLLYPDLFADVNVYDYLQEFYDTFTLMDFDVTTEAFFFCTSQDLIDAGYDLTYSS